MGNPATKSAIKFEQIKAPGVKFAIIKTGYSRPAAAREAHRANAKNNDKEA